MMITEMLNVGCYDSMLDRQDSYERIFGGDDAAPNLWQQERNEFSSPPYRYLNYHYCNIIVANLNLNIKNGGLFRTLIASFPSIRLHPQTAKY